jgi:hypothetical protein
MDGCSQPFAYKQSKIGKIRSVPPVEHFEFWMETVESAFQRPPNVLQKQLLCMAMSSLQSSPAFSRSPCKMVLKKCGVRFFKSHLSIISLEKIKNAPFPL